MCVDYTDLNKHCPKDPFPLPCIDQVVDSTAGCVLLSFLDYYSGYHQITLKESDQEKTSFITPFGAYCYNTMMFGLKNAGTTYQKAIQGCLQGQIGATPRPMSITSSSRQNVMISSLRTSPRHLKISGNSNGSSTRPSVCLVLLTLICANTLQNARTCGSLTQSSPTGSLRTDPSDWLW